MAAAKTIEPPVEQEQNVSYRRVANNAVIYFVAQIISWLVTFLTISIIPRTLGETACGQLAILGTATAPVGAMLGFGLEDYLTREVGRSPRQAERLLRAAIGLRIALHLPGVIGCFLALWLVHPSPTVWGLGTVWILLGFPGGVSGLFRSALAGWEKAKQVSLLDFVSTLTPVLTLPFLRYGPISVILCGFVTSLFVLIVRIHWVRRQIRLRPMFDLALWKLMILGGLPFVVTGLVGTLQGWSGTFVLRAFTNDAAVGVYSQAGRLFGTFLFVPTVLGYALLPAMSRLAASNESEFQSVQTRVFGALIVLGLPVTALMFVLAPPLCHVLYGTHRFVELPLALQFYSFGIIPMYVVSIAYQFLVAKGRNGLWSVVLLVTIAVQVLFSYLLIPWTLHRYHNGIIGSVLATGISEAISCIFAFRLLRVDVLERQFIGRIGRAMLATLGMVAAMWLTRGLFVAVPAIAGLAAFAVIGWQLQVLSAEEQMVLKRFVTRRFQWSRR